jgi:SSS family transporter
MGLARLVALALLASPVSGQDAAFDWSELPPLPDPIGFAGPFAGASGGALVVAGGANFPDGPPWEGHAKVWHERIFVLTEPDAQWRALDVALPRPAAYGVSASWDDALVCVGGGDATRHHEDAYLLRWDGARIRVEDLPALPQPVAFACGAVVGDALYVLGGIERPDAAECLAGGYRLDLGDPAGGWTSVAPLPGPARQLAAAGVLGDALYLFGGVTLADGQRMLPYLADAYRLDEDGSWAPLAELPHPLAGAPSPALRLGTERLALVGGDDGSLVGQVAHEEHPGFPMGTLVYDATLDRWSARDSNQPTVVTTVALEWRGRTVIPSGEVRPGVRTNRVATASARSSAPGFGWLDAAVLVLYLAAMVAVGAYFSRRESSAEDFFLGGRRVPWWAAGTSVFVTQLSAITFLALPAKTYATDWTYFIQNLGIVAITPLIVICFIPVFRRARITSIYDWLGQRFDGRLRAFGKLAYVAYQLARMGIVVFLPALALSAVTGLDVRLCIVAMGVLSTVYTVLGGIEAVIWTDVLQAVVLGGGALIGLGVMLAGSDGGPGGALELALARDKLRLADLSWDWSRPTLGVILFAAVFNNLVPYTSDQAVVQRYLTTPDERSARRAAWTGALLSLPASLLFFGIGTALFAFYVAHPERVDVTAPPDQVFATFIVRELPMGISGLVIAGVFSAAMSSLDSSMNAVAAVITPGRDREGGLRRARIVTLIIGAVGTAAALLLSGFEVRSLFDRFLEYVGLLGGSLGGLFALGVLTRRVGASAAIAGVVLSLATLAFVRGATELSPLLYAAVGMGTCFVGGLAASLVFEGRTKS